MSSWSVWIWSLGMMRGASSRVKANPDFIRFHFPNIALVLTCFNCQGFNPMCYVLHLYLAGPFTEWCHVHLWTGQKCSLQKISRVPLQMFAASWNHRQRHRMSPRFLLGFRLDLGLAGLGHRPHFFGGDCRRPCHQGFKELGRWLVVGEWLCKL